MRYAAGRETAVAKSSTSSDTPVQANGQTLLPPAYGIDIIDQDAPDLLFGQTEPDFPFGQSAFSTPWPNARQLSQPPLPIQTLPIQTANNLDSTKGNIPAAPKPPQSGKPSSVSAPAEPTAQAAPSTEKKVDATPKETVLDLAAEQTDIPVTDETKAKKEGAPPTPEKKEIELIMPEPPAKLSDKDEANLQSVHKRSRRAARTKGDLPKAKENKDAARGAVEEPKEETAALAEKELVAFLKKRPEPSPEIEELCDKIYKIIRDKRPPDEESLVDAKPEEMAKEAGGELNQSLNTKVQGVDTAYNDLDSNPQGQIKQKPTPLTSPPNQVGPNNINPEQGAPTPISKENLSLDKDVKATQKRIDDAGMNNEVTAEIKDGPVAKARETQVELGKTAEQAHAEMIAAQEAAIVTSKQDMANLQLAALEALNATRRSTIGGTVKQQGNMVTNEQLTRAEVSRRAQSIYSFAQEQVNNLLNPLVKTAMGLWEAGKTKLAQEFKDHLKKVDDWIEERHSGVGGFFLGVADYVSGLPDWVTEHYDDAEKKFGDGICELIRTISKKVNTIIATCEFIIANANKQINDLFTQLGTDLPDWAEKEQAKFQERLDGLSRKVRNTRDNFNKDLTNRAAQTVQDVRLEIHARREAAKGLIGRIADAIEEFIEDPIRAIINGLLRAVGIEPARFWSVVKRIGEVISDIADDPLGFARNLLAGVSQGFQQFSDHLKEHLFAGFFDWLFEGLGSVGVEIPPDFSLKSIITFILQLMGISWDRIRTLLVVHIGEENVAHIEKAWEIIATLIEKGPSGIFELIKDKLDPQTIVNQILETAVTFLTETLVEQIAVRVLMLFNPVGAILQAIQAIYKILKWIFQNAARLFTFIETIVNSLRDIVAGNTGDVANAVENSLRLLIAPVIDFIAKLAGLDDLPDKIAETIKGFQDWVESILNRVIGWLAEKGKALLTSVEGGIAKIKEFFGIRTKFKTEEGESHSIYFEDQGGESVLMIASSPASINNFLKFYETEYEIEKDSKKGILIADIRGFIKDKIRPKLKDLQTANRANDEAKANQIQQELLDLNVTLSGMLRTLLSGDKDIGFYIKSYLLEGLTGTYASIPNPSSDELTPDHQPQAAILEWAAEQRYFGKTSPMAQRAAGRANNGYAINLHEIRHMAGRTYGSKGSGTKAAFIEKAKQEAAKQRTNQAKREVVVNLIKEELSHDVDAINNVVDKGGKDPTKHPHWADIKELPLRKDEKVKLVETIRGNIKKGEMQMLQQELESLKD